MRTPDNQKMLLAEIRFRKLKHDGKTHDDGYGREFAEDFAYVWLTKAPPNYGIGILHDPASFAVLQLKYGGGYKLVECTYKHVWEAINGLIQHYNRQVEREHAEKDPVERLADEAIDTINIKMS